ncbi:MAG: murein biosynthesis integral membrane protein MurJ [Candidatus Doudnabacteria bacterium RIFCSPHIGHO2_01_FULL_46_14]|uniref:Probable lipid II flippase MurJ n=1 Tax=Candidatus Doudnabacteria bacterium RIFCSPHIGHO2_01_FULL_46_14 TaxID=1817824 RepID=A0A1F5NP30_9BACT|nr:MAG: murein biosynthesis integral membrane protein MurJ [Candidatus Doudnabacteria bacterium RIFCSPHIGHO2_01_FULL_46_14]
MYRATVYIAIFAILSKILGLARIIVFSNRFGAGQDIDIYVAAFRVPDFIFNLLILGTLSAAFIPVFVSYLERNRQEAFQIASTIFNLTLLVMSAAGILGFIFAPLLVKIIAPGFEVAASAKTLELTRILMLSPIFLALSSVLTSVLQSFKKFVIASLAPLFYNLSIIFGVFFLYPKYGLTGIVWAVIGGAFLHFAIQLPSVLRLGLPFGRHFTLKHAGVRQIGRLFLPRIFGLDLGQIGLLISSIIGSLLPAGSIAVYYYAFDLETMPLGVFAIAFATTAFPVLSEYASKNNFAGFKSFLSKTIVQLLFLIIPISVLMLVLRAQIVRLFLGAGQNTNFSFADTRLTALALAFFAISLFAQAIIPLLARAFYAMHNTLIPVLFGAVAIIINAVLALIFTRFMSPASMALAFSAAAIFDLVCLFIFLRRRLGNDLNDDYLFLSIMKISIASVAAGTVSYAGLYLIAPVVNMQTYLGIFLQTAGSLLLGGLAYISAGLMIGLPEAKGFVNVIRTWFAKFSKSVTALAESLFTDLR